MKTHNDDPKERIVILNSRVAESKLESLLDAVEKVREETMTKNVISMEEKAS